MYLVVPPGGDWLQQFISTALAVPSNPVAPVRCRDALRCWPHPSTGL